MKTLAIAAALALALTACGSSKADDDPIVTKNLQNGKVTKQSEIVKTVKALKGTDRIPCDQMLSGIKLSGQIEFPNGEQAWLKACREGYGQ